MLMGKDNWRRRGKETKRDFIPIKKGLGGVLARTGRRVGHERERERTPPPCSCDPCTKKPFLGPRSPLPLVHGRYSVQGTGRVPPPSLVLIGTFNRANDATARAILERWAGKRSEFFVCWSFVPKTFRLVGSQSVSRGSGENRSEKLFALLEN
ncbi:hypothetical protein LX32DRAFT_241601 [Colletotrichum zoysiae]|uniref:Uncharacterized protein n=1 Tax=Colletotrichum zoysiae TaxID=1216348 RepID=A0AAD9H4D2_9PEZI|nr:hypothetical protein LX32DRAFT_241601 [Colletotrichum zoysiae]